MKESYFASPYLKQQALELYQGVAEQTQGKSVRFLPQQSALLVLDMQEYFLTPASHAYVPSAPAIVAGITQLIEAFTSCGRPIIFTQHINRKRNAGMMATWWKDLVTEQNPFHRVIPEIDVAAGRLIQKSQYDAFYRTSLEKFLRADEVKQVVICGVMTHLCCETTARSAFVRGFEVFFPVDGTATYNLELHRASLTTLAHGFASLPFVGDILEAMRGEHEC